MGAKNPRRKCGPPKQELPAEKAPHEKTYPREESSGWLVAEGTRFIPPAYWPLYDRTAKAVAPWDDLLEGSRAVDFLRGELNSLAYDWTLPRTANNRTFWTATEMAIRRALMRVRCVAPLVNLSTEEMDRLEAAYPVIDKGLCLYGETCTTLRLAGGDSAPDGRDLQDQWHKLHSWVPAWDGEVEIDPERPPPPSPTVTVKCENPKLAAVLLAVDQANPFRGNPAIATLIEDGGVFERLYAKLRDAYKRAHPEDFSPNGRPAEAKPDLAAEEPAGAGEHQQPPAGATSDLPCLRPDAMRLLRALARSTVLRYVENDLATDSVFHDEETGADGRSEKTVRRRLGELRVRGFAVTRGGGGSEITPKGRTYLEDTEKMRSASA